MKNPEDPRPAEASFLEKDVIWRDFIRQELSESDRPLEDTIEEASLHRQEMDSALDSTVGDVLDVYAPELSISENYPLFWDAFLNYVTSTRRKPDTPENLIARFYKDGEVKRHIVDVLLPQQSMEMVLLQCLRELNPAFILIEKDDHYSIFEQEQLPQNVPKGGVYDLPIDAYLRQQGWDTKQVKKIHNRFTKHIKDIDPSLIIQSQDYEHDIAKGYRMGILTVGSLVAFNERFPIGHVSGFADSTPDLVLQTLKADKRVYQPTGL